VEVLKKHANTPRGTGSLSKSDVVIRAKDFVLAFATMYLWRKFFGASQMGDIAREIGAGQIAGVHSIPFQYSQQGTRPVFEFAICENLWRASSINHGHQSSTEHFPPVLSRPSD
jgi:hypothetical protein